MSNYREESRKNWSRSDGSQPTTEQLLLGCQQRIADATEAMAQNYLKLQRDAANYEKWWLEERAKTQKMTASMNSLKGHLTRAKNKIKSLVIN